jgi:hypothetical protein
MQFRPYPVCYDLNENDDDKWLNIEGPSRSLRPEGAQEERASWKRLRAVGSHSITDNH